MHWTELEITGKIRNLSPELWSIDYLTSLHLNDNNLPRLPPEICKLVNLIHLDVSCNKLRSLPAEVGDLINLKELILNNNFLRNLPYELGKLFQLQKLELKGNPLSPEILSYYSDSNGTQKLLTYMLDNLHFTATHPPQRPWLPLGQPNRSKSTAIFTVMCYNVLCDKYATRQIYGYCPSWALNWEYRRKAILDEIRHYNADIISLQEVETDQFFNFFLPELTVDGYNGIFSPKSRARTMSLDQDRKHVDGCAIFFRISKFTLVKEFLVEFNQLAIANAEGSDDMLNRVMTKDNIGLAALLETKEGCFESGMPSGGDQVPQPVLVTTAHIHWDPQFCDVKLVQTMMLMSELKTIIEDLSVSLRPGSTKKDVNSIPIVFCGDLNSLPESGVIEYLKTGKISTNHEDFKDMAYASTVQKLSTSDNKDILKHNFKLSSAYSEDVMPYTNYTFDFKGIIDYIFYSTDFIKPLGVLGPLDPEWFNENKVLGAPHPHVPSDHFALLTEFEMIPFFPQTRSISMPTTGHPVKR